MTILSTSCLTLPAPAIPPTVPPTPPMPVNCTFETGLCNWNNLKTGDQFDWTRHRGSTYSTNTGPSIDHTTNSNKGYYIYIETSSPRSRGHVAKLESGTITPTTGTSGKCFSFWFHMFGADVDTLNLYTRTLGTLKK